MNKSLRYIAFLAIIPLFTTGLTTDYFTDAEAYKSQGVPNPKFDSRSKVCGLQLCSEIPGGKAAWEEQRGQTTPSGQRNCIRYARQASSDENRDSNSPRFLG